MIYLSISIVTYHVEPKQFREVMQSLSAAINRLLQANKNTRVTLIVVDNSVNNDAVYDVKMVLDSVDDRITTRLINNQKNIGFGAAHNLAIRSVNSDYHLIMNPDVVMENDALIHALFYMENNIDVGLLTPRARNRYGESAYLCKRYPSVLDLFVRGFCPTWCKAMFSARLKHYEMQDATKDQSLKGIPIASGCFMFFRTGVLQQLGGFDRRYFMYFEDFDLCMRMKSVSVIAYVPMVKITHYGGHAAKKGLKHIWMFALSSHGFFSQWGWKWW